MTWEAMVTPWILGIVTHMFWLEFKASKWFRENVMDKEASE